VEVWNLYKISLVNFFTLYI